MKHPLLRRILSLLLLLTLLTAIAPNGFAKSSTEIQEEIDKLEEEAKQIEAEQQEIEQKLTATNAEAVGYAEQKLQIDRDMELAHREIDNLNERIHQYSLLIAEKQAELDELSQQQAQLTQRYQQRMRAIQENGTISPWAVLFQSSSFADMLRRQAMTEEIARSDQKMIDELTAMATQVLDAKQVLADEKLLLEQSKAELAEAEADLESKRAEADGIIAKLAADKAALLEAQLQAEKEVAELDAEIAQREKELTAAKLAEGGPGIPTESGFIFPVSMSGYVYMSSPYGNRYHPISGNYTFHNGTDFAAYQGTPIFASKTGTVSTAAGGYGWGNYVVINHGDGFSTLYAHMTYFIVSQGQTVTQGQVIGYVGSTGNSTGPHLHFTVYYNGSTINPLQVVALP